MTNRIVYPISRRGRVPAVVAAPSLDWIPENGQVGYPLDLLDAGGTNTVRAGADGYIYAPSYATPVIVRYNTAGGHGFGVATDYQALDLSTIDSTINAAWDAAYSPVDGMVYLTAWHNGATTTCDLIRVPSNNFTAAAATYLNLNSAFGINPPPGVCVDPTTGLVWYGLGGSVYGSDGHFGCFHGSAITTLANHTVVNLPVQASNPSLIGYAGLIASGGIVRATQQDGGTDANSQQHLQYVGNQTGMATNTNYKIFNAYTTFGLPELSGCVGQAATFVNGKPEYFIPHYRQNGGAWGHYLLWYVGQSSALWGLSTAWLLYDLAESFGLGPNADGVLAPAPQGAWSDGSSLWLSSTGNDFLGRVNLLTLGSPSVGPGPAVGWVDVRNVLVANGLPRPRHNYTVGPAGGAGDKYVYLGTFANTGGDGHTRLIRFPSRT